jgi:hypothetical protein
LYTLYKKTSQYRYCNVLWNRLYRPISFYNTIAQRWMHRSGEPQSDPLEAFNTYRKLILSLKIILSPPICIFSIYGVLDRCSFLSFISTQGLCQLSSPIILNSLSPINELHVLFPSERDIFFRGGACSFLLLPHFKEAYSVSFEIFNSVILYGHQIIWTVKIWTTESAYSKRKQQAKKKFQITTWQIMQWERGYIIVTLWP